MPAGMELGIPVGTMALIAMVVFVAATFQASIGFGANVLAQPIVFLIDASLVPGAILMAFACMSVLVMTRDREAIDRRPAGGVLIGLLIGVVVGVFTVRAASPDALAIIIATIVLAMVAMLSIDRFEIEPTANNVSIASMVGGFTGTTSGIGGPPLALVYQKATGPTVRGSLASYFVVASTVSLIGLAIAGRFGWRQLTVGACLIPVVVAAYFTSGPLLPIVDRGVTRPAILTVSALSAVTLLARTLF